MKENEYLFFKLKAEELLEQSNIQKLKEFQQHAGVNRLEHSVYVAYSSYCLCRRLKLRVDYDSLIRGAVLHDYFLYDWKDINVSPRWHGIVHPRIAYRNAKSLFSLNIIEKDIILTHMWPLTIFHIPKHRESIIVCLADKICALMEGMKHPVFIPEFMS